MKKRTIDYYEAKLHRITFKRKDWKYELWLTNVRKPLKTLLLRNCHVTTSLIQIPLGPLLHGEVTLTQPISKYHFQLTFFRTPIVQLILSNLLILLVYLGFYPPCFYILVYQWAFDFALVSSCSWFIQLHKEIVNWIECAKNFHKCPWCGILSPFWRSEHFIEYNHS